MKRFAIVVAVLLVVGAFDPAGAKRLLAEAGYPGGFDAGEYFCDMTSADAAEAMIGYL